MIAKKKEKGKIPRTGQAEMGGVPNGLLKRRFLTEKGVKGLLPFLSYERGC